MSIESEELRDKLNKYILNCKTQDKKVIELSQELDKYMVKEQKECMAIE